VKFKVANLVFLDAFLSPMGSKSQQRYPHVPLRKFSCNLRPGMKG